MVHLWLKNKAFLLHEALIGLFVISLLVLVICGSVNIQIRQRDIMQNKLKESNELFFEVIASSWQEEDPS